MTDYDEIVKLLPRLSREQLHAVMARAGALSSMPGPQPGNSDDCDESLALECICAMMKSKGMEFATPVLLRKSPVFNSFKTEKVPAVMAYLGRAGFTRNETRAMMQIGLELLMADLGRMGLMISGRALMSHFHRIPSLLNHAFPGYAEAGLLIQVLCRKRE